MTLILGGKGDTMLILENITIISPSALIPHQDIIVKGEWIAEVRDHRGGTYPAQATRIDGTHLMVTPGWVDLQVNGGFGYDFTLTPDAIWKVAERLPTLGITAFLPTIITSPPETWERAMGVWQQGPPRGWRGAVPLGWHFEGPFLNVEKRGAHPIHHLRLPDRELVRSWSRER
ncbi:MAG: N-acetylglucosamine-6-phosphate deacetylase, partial [Chloroflexi bacterium]